MNREEQFKCITQAFHNLLETVESESGSTEQAFQEFEEWVRSEMDGMESTLIRHHEEIERLTRELDETKMLVRVLIRRNEKATKQR